MINPNIESRNPKQALITKSPNSKVYDLEERTFVYAQRVRRFVKRIPRTVGNFEDGKQLIRSSGSPGANYIEANETLGKKDFLMKIKTCRKETKESIFWLRLIDTGNDVPLETERSVLVNEGTELMKIFGSIVRKTEAGGS